MRTKILRNHKVKIILGIALLVFIPMHFVAAEDELDRYLARCNTNIDAIAAELSEVLSQAGQNIEIKPPIPVLQRVLINGYLQQNPNLPCPDQAQINDANTESGTDPAPPETANNDGVDEGNISVTAGFDKLENPLGGTGITSISGAIEKVLKLVLRIAIPFVTLMLIYSGFLFVKAQGDPAQIQKARATFLSVIIGAVLLMGCAIIANAIANTIEKVGKTASESN